MDEREKAHDGKGNGAMYSSTVGDSMQRVMLCSDWCALEGYNPNPSTHTEGHVRVFHPRTGKPSAWKGARSVWTGGKIARPYLSVFLAKIGNRAHHSRNGKGVRGMVRAREEERSEDMPNNGSMCCWKV